MRSFSRRTSSFDNFTQRIEMADDPEMVKYTQAINGNTDDFEKIKSHSIDSPNGDNQARSPYRQINRNNINNKKGNKKYLEFSLIIYNIKFPNTNIKTL